jgi:hypothetical protein
MSKCRLAGSAIATTPVCRPQQDFMVSASYRSPGESRHRSYQFLKFCPRNPEQQVLTGRRNHIRIDGNANLAAEKVKQDRDAIPVSHSVEQGKIV